MASMIGDPMEGPGVAELTARWTPLYKFGVPGALGAWFAYTALQSFAVAGRSESFFDTPWFMLGWFLLIFASFCWDIGRVKGVRLDGDTLVITNYLREVRVPLDALVEVQDQFTSRGPRTVTLVFNRDTGFGYRVRIVPLHGDVDRIRTLTGLSEALDEAYRQAAAEEPAEEQTFEQMWGNAPAPVPPPRKPSPPAAPMQPGPSTGMPDIPDMSQPIHPSGCLGVMTLMALVALSAGIALTLLP